MLPYRIGRLSVPRFANTAYRELYELVVNLLHTVCEIRNVFYLDLNMFEGANEAGSAHSLAMRARTYNKFVTSSMPMLCDAIASFLGKTTSIHQTSTNSCPRFCNSDLTILKAFSDHVQAFFIAISGTKISLATELAQAGKDFLSELLDAVACLAETVGTLVASECGPELRILGLQSSCDKAQERMEHLFHSIVESPLDCADRSCITTALSSLSGHELPGGGTLSVGSNLAIRELRKGDCIFRTGDILDIIFVVLDGSVTSEDLGIETDYFTTGTAFGATDRTTRFAPQKQKLGNQTMTYTAVVASEVCRIAVLHPVQLVLSKMADNVDSSVVDGSFFDETDSSRSISSSTRSSYSASQSRFKNAVLSVVATRSIGDSIRALAIRKSGLMEYFSPEICNVLANASSEIVIEPKQVLCQAGESATMCWILMEGRVGVEVDGTIVWQYTRSGQLLGERGFAKTARKTDDVFYEESLVAMSGSTTRLLVIPRDTIDKVIIGPLKKEFRALMKLDSVLSKDPMLQKLPKASRSGLLRLFRQVRIPAHEVVFERGEAGHSAFAVISGKLELRDVNGVVIRELRPGSMTGLDLLMRPGERDATCVVAVDGSTTCWTANHDGLCEALLPLASSTEEVLQNFTLRITI
jgi:CRP-like cAMP-binding protein